MLHRLLFSMWMAIFCQSVYALDSDVEQPATLDADDMEMDFSTGVRIYRGNVVFVQGTIRMTCDELTTYFNDDGELDEAVCVGSPGRFKQRPEGQDEDVVGIANSITMNQVEDLVTLKSRAKVVQGETTITGRLITYNLKTEKASVKGGGQNTGSSGSVSTSESGDSSLQGGETEEASRPSLVIQPRTKKVEEKAPVPEVESEAAATATE